MEESISDEMLALEEAIAKAGGVGALAEKIGVKYSSTISNWRQREKVPAEYCPAIQRETGVLCDRLCPGADWGFLRKAAIQSVADVAKASM